MKKIISLIVLIMVAAGVTFAQTASSSDGVFKVMGVNENVPTNMFTTPGEGMRFVAFDIVVDRRGSTGISFDIRVRDSNYRIYTPAAMSYALVNPSLPLRIDDDDIVRGWLVISIPINVPITGLQIRLAQLYGDNITGWLTLK